MSADVWRITGTLLYAPLSVLRGEPHTVSSQLEGLFLSVLNLSCNGNTHAHDIRSHKLEMWEISRHGALTRLQLLESNIIFPPFEAAGARSARSLLPQRSRRHVPAVSPECQSLGSHSNLPACLQQPLAAVAVLL